MNEKKNMREMFDTRLSGIRVKEEHYHAITNALEGEAVVKKKFSVTLVAALLLILLLAGIAYAIVSWQQVGQQAAIMESEQGYYENWSVKDKTELIRLLVEASQINRTNDVQDLLDGKLDDASANELLTKTIEEWTNMPEDAVTLMSILERMLGRYSKWSIEEKAWYTRTLKGTERLGSDEEIHLLPSADDISQDRALEIAQRAISDAFGVDTDILAIYEVDYDFYAMPESQEQTKWLVEFRPLVNGVYADAPEYYVAIDSKSGDVVNDQQRGIVTPEEAARYADSMQEEYADEEALRAEKGEPHKWTLEERAMYIPWHGLPGTDDISIEEAISIAKDALLNKVANDKLRHCVPYASFIIDSLSMHDPYWQVDFIREATDGSIAEIYTVYLDPKTGEILTINNDSNG